MHILFNLERYNLDFSRCITPAVIYIYGWLNTLIFLIEKSSILIFLFVLKGCVQF